MRLSSQPDRSSSPISRYDFVIDVLIADADTRFGKWLDESLSRHGLRVTFVSCGDAALSRLRADAHAIALVDRELQTVDGLGVIRQARSEGINLPIIMSGSLARIRDRVEALDTGADDYLVKPYAITELIARVRSSVMRDIRAGRARAEINASASLLELNGFQLDLLRKEFGRGPDRIKLQQREVQFLTLLMQEDGGLVTRDRFYDCVLAEGQDRSTNLVDMHISRIRRKLGELARQVQIVSVRGQGYRLKLAAPLATAIG
jgi:two-component system, OmpR family, response regulator